MTTSEFTLNPSKLVLTLTGSSVFSGTLDPNDLDYFGRYHLGRRHSLEALGFAEKISYFENSIRFARGDYDIFLFTDSSAFEKYRAAHSVAKKFKLRDMFSTKEEFMQVFNLMRSC